MSSTAAVITIHAGGVTLTSEAGRRTIAVNPALQERGVLAPIDVLYDAAVELADICSPDKTVLRIVQDGAALNQLERSALANIGASIRASSIEHAHTSEGPFKAVSPPKVNNPTLVVGPTFVQRAGLSRWWPAKLKLSPGRLMLSSAAKTGAERSASMPVVQGSRYLFSDYGDLADALIRAKKEVGLQSGAMVRVVDADHLSELEIRLLGEAFEHAQLVRHGASSNAHLVKQPIAEAIGVWVFAIAFGYTFMNIDALARLTGWRLELVYSGAFACYLGASALWYYVRRRRRQDQLRGQLEPVGAR